MKKILVQIIIFFLLTSCSKQDKINLETGNLWKIESKNGLESYIFGTIHLYPKTEIQLSENVILKLQNCNILALESDMTNEQEQKKLIDFQMPEFVLESYRIILSEYGDELISMESQLIEKAQKSNIKVAGMETVDEILDIMKTIRKIQISDNIFITEEMLSDYQQSLKMYNDESIGKLKEIMKIQMGKEITKILIDNRNENWIDNIESFVEKDKTFIAIGVGHLGGKNGVLKLLIEKGYKLERIKI